jgi:hypothetical protein
LAEHIKIRKREVTKIGYSGSGMHKNGKIKIKINKILEHLNILTDG